jgi:hypothetical protein
MRMRMMTLSQAVSERRTNPRAYFLRALEERSRRFEKETGQAWPHIERLISTESTLEGESVPVEGLREVSKLIRAALHFKDMRRRCGENAITKAMGYLLDVLEEQMRRRRLAS